MPANGTALARLPLPEPTPAKTTAAKLDADPAATQLERAIGVAVADAAVVVAQAAIDFKAVGQLAPTTRSQGGDVLAKVARLQLDTFGEIDFAAVALAEGRRVLNQRHGKVFRQQLDLDAAALDAAFAEILGWVIAIADRTVRAERAFLAH